jgi:RimJ/RimL family protein N-acetyltransferase
MKKAIFIFDDKERVGLWVAKEVEQTASWGSFYAMGIELDGDLVSGIVFNNFNGSNATAHIAVKRFTKLFPELLHHAIKYAFKENKLKRLTGMVEADNEKALKLDKHIGFEHEFTMRMAGNNGKDLIVLVLWPDKCQRWLKGD